MKKKIFLALNVFLLVSLLLSDIRYFLFGTLARKAFTSSVFVALGLVNAVYALTVKAAPKRFALVMLAGLFFAMLGDIVLGKNFILGVVMFALGHLLYAVAYALRAKFARADLLPAAIVLLLSVVFLNLPFIRIADPVMNAACYVYAVIISCMVGKALGNLLHSKSAADVLIAVGSVLFYFSDMMLVLAWFGGAPKIADTLCLFTYFPGQIILAHAVYHAVNE